MPNIGLVGVVNATTDGVVGTSGAIYRIYDVVLNCGSTTSNISLYNGTSATGLPIITLQGAKNNNANIIFNVGKRFDSGVYLSFASTVTSNVSISLITEF
jgi:hypothetical protein